MNYRKDLQLEKLIDDAIKRSTFKRLEELQEESDEIISCNCSKQLTNKLNRLILRELSKKEIRNAGLLLSCIHKYGKHMTIEGEDGLAAMINEGLVQKAKKIWANSEGGKNEALTNFAEDFFDALMAIFNYNKEGRCQVLDMFLYRIGSVVTNDHVSVYIQEEAIKKMNSMLNQMSLEDRKRALLSSEMQLLMNDFGKKILDAGDYNLQVSITESLCRMTSESRRQELANNWFHVEFVVDAFKKIKDSEFETDCRRFLNQVNGILGGRTSVSTYPCLEVFLDNCELRMPFDNKVEDFWIDFNIGSRSISFYVITEEDENEPMWETVCLPEDEVKSYSVEVKNEKKLLSIDTNIPVRIGNIEGNQIQIYFDLALDILSVAMKVYNSIKYKQSSMKDRISEVKTAVHVIFDGSSSQVLVAENQLSPPSCKETGKQSHSKEWTDNGLKQDVSHSIKPLAARNRKTSEVSVVVTSTEMLTRKSTCMSTAVNATPARKTRMKPPLEMKNSSGRNNTFKVRSDEAEPGNSVYVDLPEERAAHMFVEEKSTKNAIESKESTDPIKVTSQCSKSLQKELAVEKITSSKVVELLQEEDERNLTSQTDQQESLNDIVPDSQPVVLKQQSLLPGLLDNIHKDQKCFSKKRCWVSDSPASSCGTAERKTVSVKYAFQPDDWIIKHQAFCSIFDEKSPKENDRNKFKNSKNEALEMQLEGKLEKVTPGGMHERSGTSIKDNHKKVQHTATRTFNPSSTMVSATEKLCLHSVCQTKFPENMVSEMDKFKLDEICHNIGGEKQNTPNSIKSSKRYKTNLMCKNQQKKRECDVRENTVTEKMISEIAAKYTNETKEKHVNKEAPRSTRYRLDELHDKKLQKNLKDEKWTWKRQKGGVDCTVNLKNKMEDSVLDVYSFDDSFTAEPTVSLGMQDKKMPQQACLNKRKSEKMNTKHKPTKKEEIHKSVGKVNRKHFFTDTDTDGKTEISWLQQSNRKTKPELLVYSRQRKRNMADNLDKGKTTTTVRTDCGKISKDKKNPTEKINLKEVPAEKKQRICPQRAAAMQKSYKEVSESASDSYGESPSLSHHRESDLIMQVPAKKIRTNAKEKAIMLADYEQQNETFEASTVVSYENTSAEKIRYEKPCESEVLTRSSSLVESLPSIHTDSSPEPLQSPHLSLVATNPCKFSSNVLKTATPLSSPDFSAAKATFTSGFSAIISPISLVTPLCPEINENSENAQQELVKLKNPDEDIITNKSQSSENSFTSTRSPNSFTLSSILNKKATAEETPSRSTILEKNRREEKDRVPSAEAHTSGPTRYSSVLKRICGKNLQRDYSDVEEEGPIEQKAKLKPRRLFSFDFGRPNRDPELLSTSNGGSSIRQVDLWGQSEPNMGVLCQQFSKELKVKLQRHSQRIDSFTKFSLKSLQQRMSSTNVQIHSYRLQRLNKFQAIVMQELQHFEKDCLSLKCMEKELSNFWKQRSEAFNELKENQEERIQHLRSSLENNVCHSMEIEEKIFSTEMHLMRKDMKAVQDRLLKEMQEEELLTVRRGLQSFFLSETTPF